MTTDPLGREVLDSPAFIAGFLLLALTTSWVSHRLVELPLNHRLRRAFAALWSRNLKAARS